LGFTEAARVTLSGAGIRAVLAPARSEARAAFSNSASVVEPRRLPAEPCTLAASRKSCEVALRRLCGVSLCSATASSRRAFAVRDRVAALTRCVFAERLPPVRFAVRPVAVFELLPEAVAVRFVAPAVDRADRFAGADTRVVCAAGRCAPCEEVASSPCPEDTSANATVAEMRAFSRILKNRRREERQSTFYPIPPGLQPEVTRRVP
jgi:hypothetical protein